MSGLEVIDTILTLYIQ